MKQYLDVLKDIMENGVIKPNRTGVDTKGVFGRMMRFDLSKGFPAVTTKKLAWYPMFAELVFFLSGHKFVDMLHKMNCHIWDHDVFSDEWVKKIAAKSWPKGYMGRTYGVQWRQWLSPDSGKFVDQIDRLIGKIKKNPNDRRMIVSAWNAGEIDEMCLPPCHMLFQVYIANGKLSIAMTQRSCDMFLGVPFNIASYALLTHLLAKITGYEAGELVHYLNDAHVYSNHFDQVNEQLSREPRPLPTLWLNPALNDLDDMVRDIFGRISGECPENPKKVLDSYARLEKYNPYPTLKGELAGSKKP